ncbi:hypothetical protein JRO89_XS02G0126200 [Xanthoceras sorbifolium]|uniref:DUF7026 domain-containing protein n=1 Tax=Xanthoceras sorbifolium TaxID=99658 RepID=A0ABQ8IFT4_9ROSI|nr:hypothetical protein JRO89_XS02G0126200 [Xanthoceras sorbifolium]
MKKSKYLLFTELCQFLDLKEDQVKKKWSKFDEDEKWDLVKGFVSVWSVHFHPLSPRSVKQMIEEYLRVTKCADVAAANTSLTDSETQLHPIA